MNDLELAAKYEVQSSLKNLLENLRDEFHLIKLNGNKTCEFMIFVPKDFADDKKKILRLLYMTSARDDGISLASDVKSKIATTSGIKTTTSNSNLIKKSPLCSTVSTPTTTSKEEHEINLRFHNYSRRYTTTNFNDTIRFNQQQTLSSSEGSNTIPNSPQTDNDSYLLYLSVSTKDQNNKEDSTWKGFEITIEASIDIKMKLLQHKTHETSSYLYLVVGQPHNLSDKKIKLKSKLGKHVTLVKEKTSFHPNISIELDELNTKILKNLPTDAFKFIEALEKDTSKPFQADLIISSQHNSTKSLIKKFLLEIWRVCYNYGIELHMECVKFITQALHRDFSIGLAEFCKLWCNYVSLKTEEGYGRTTKPSWARKGFQLMNEVFKPQNSVHLTEEEFDELRKSVEICIKHVIGTKREKPLIYTGPFDVTDAILRHKKNYIASYSMTGQNVNMAPHLLQSQSSVVLRAQEFLQEQQLKTLLPPHKRFSLRSKETDENRAYDLRENKLIGQTIDRHENCFNINQAKISVRRVEFRWQRGNKIGFGSTGIVYACVNLDTGEMMAMKEIQYKPNDLQMIKSLADEIANIEGIKHENLVKFYGVELHKKEILIFMEFCGDKCTLGNFD
jgi:mitogen-activated protein kinase kinase kinase 4